MARRTGLKWVYASGQSYLRNFLSQVWHTTKLIRKVPGIMLGRTHLRKILAIATLASLFGLSSLGWSEQVRAERGDRKTNLGLPSRRVGGATRGDADDGASARQCSSLIALNPQYLVTTTKALPTLFFCLPTLVRADRAKIAFSLRDDLNREVYHTTLTPVTQSGIVSLTLPTSTKFKELEIGRNYRWRFSIVADGSDRVAQGWIQRIPMTSTLTNRLDRASSLERVKLYREAKLWYESLEELAQLKRSQPNNAAVSEQWKQLLSSVNLSAIASVPLLDTSLSPQASSPVLNSMR
jgi:hypothetical protein